MQFVLMRLIRHLIRMGSPAGRRRPWGHAVLCLDINNFNTSWNIYFYVIVYFIVLFVPRFVVQSFCSFLGTFLWYNIIITTGFYAEKKILYCITCNVFLSYKSPLLLLLSYVKFIEKSSYWCTYMKL